MFIPEKEAEARFNEKKVFNSTWTEAKAQEFVEIYRQIYTDIKFTLKWDNLRPNSWSFPGKYIDIYQGLFNNSGIQLEGIALVIAHEIGHHKGGIPRYTDGLSCESQADYYGAGIIMKEVWGNIRYNDIMDKAIDQIAIFWKVPNSPLNPGGSSNCENPSYPCRLATFYAAKNGLVKPSC